MLTTIRRTLAGATVAPLRRVALGVALTLPLAGCVEVVAPVVVEDDYACTSSVIYRGETLTGFLSGNDCLSLDGSDTYSDFYEFTLYDTEWVDLYLESGHVDAYLTLYDEWDNVIAEDDDSLGNRDAWITAKLPAGRYTIAASSYGTWETGRYYLTVE